MGKRENNLKIYLNGGNKYSKPLDLPTLADYKASDYYAEIFSIYKELGGIQNEIPFSINKLDYFSNGKIVELDEENHFNRHREITLQASIYETGITLDKNSYIQYCQLYESNCQTHGGYWENSSTKKRFGPSDDPGILNKLGSSRWKQRAFYDMLKDFIPYFTDISIKRISIYDKIDYKGNNLTVGTILQSGDLKYLEIINRLIN